MFSETIITKMFASSGFSIFLLHVLIRILLFPTSPNYSCIQLFIYASMYSSILILLYGL